jgi:hypothetical protein
VRDHRGRRSPISLSRPRTRDRLRQLKCLSRSPERP